MCMLTRRPCLTSTHHAQAAHSTQLETGVTNGCTHETHTLPCLSTHHHLSHAHLHMPATCCHETTRPLDTLYTAMHDFVSPSSVARCGCQHTQVIEFKLKLLSRDILHCRCYCLGENCPLMTCGNSAESIPVSTAAAAAALAAAARLRLPPSGHASSGNPAWLLAHTARRRSVTPRIWGPPRRSW